MMKVTVCINDTKIVVPCGDGDLSVRQLAELAIIRYRKTVSLKCGLPDWVEISSLKLARDGGILDWDDKVQHVLDDRDMLIAQHASPVVIQQQQLKFCSDGSSGPTTRTTTTTGLGGSSSNSISVGSLPTSSPQILPHRSQPSAGYYSQQQQLGVCQMPAVAAVAGQQRHNSIPCSSDHELLLRLPTTPHHQMSGPGATAASGASRVDGCIESSMISHPSVRHESLDNILVVNSKDKLLNFTASFSKDYERWPLPPFPTNNSTLKSSNDATLIALAPGSRSRTPDDQTWDNSDGDGDDEDYPRLRPDYIVNHQPDRTGQETGPLSSPQNKDVLHWLATQEQCGSSVGSSGGLPLEDTSSAAVVTTTAATSSLSTTTANSATVAPTASPSQPMPLLEDRNNNRIFASCSSMSSGNELHQLNLQNRTASQETTSSQPLPSLLEQFVQQLMDLRIVVRLVNARVGENLGIKIIPAYLPASFLAETEQHLGATMNVSMAAMQQKSIYGIEVHSIMPEGRVAKEKQFNKGDQIIQINDKRLISLSYEKAELQFRDSLTRPECLLHVVPVAKVATIPAIVLALVQRSHPPPPPRRSPNTALSRGPQTVVTGANKLQPAVITTTTAGGSQNPVASWTSGLGSMVHTPASSTSSVPAATTSFNTQQHQHQPRQALPAVPAASPAIATTQAISLTKEGSGFGFSITGKDQSTPSKPSAVYVRHILSDGAAIRNGNLKPGDRILEIDGLLLDGMSQSEVICLLREKPNGSRVKLVVERPPTEGSHDVIDGDSCALAASTVVMRQRHKHLLNPCSASHDSLITSVSEAMDEDASTLSKNKHSFNMLHIDIPLMWPCPPGSEAVANGTSIPGVSEPATLGVSVKVEPNWDRSSITQHSSKEEIDASNVVWVKTVIENGAAHRHGKLLMGDQILKVNDQTLSGMSSEKALSCLKNIIKATQEVKDEDPLVRMVVLRRMGSLRSSSLTTLNSGAGSGSAASFLPFCDVVGSKSYLLPKPLWGPSTTEEAKSKPPGAISSSPPLRAAIVPPMAAPASTHKQHQQHSSKTTSSCFKPLNKAAKAAAIASNNIPTSSSQYNIPQEEHVYQNQPPRPPPPPSMTAVATNDIGASSPPPPLQLAARRLRKSSERCSPPPIIVTLADSSQSLQLPQQQQPSSTSSITNCLSSVSIIRPIATVASSYVATTANTAKTETTATTLGFYPYHVAFSQSDSYINAVAPSRPGHSSTSNTLCRPGRDRSQSEARARQVRSHCCASPPTNSQAPLHLTDVDWSRMELVPFDPPLPPHSTTVTATSSGSNNDTESSSNTALQTDLTHAKKSNEVGAHKRKRFKMFYLTQLFKHTIIPKPSNSAGSSPVATRRHQQVQAVPTDSTDRQSATSAASCQPGFPASNSSHSIRSSFEPEEQPEYPYADLDFVYGPVSCLSVLAPPLPPSAVANASLAWSPPLPPSRQSRIVPQPPAQSLQQSAPVTAPGQHQHHMLQPLVEESAPLPPPPANCLRLPQPAFQDDSDDSYEDFEDVQAVIPGYMSAVDRITAAMPKQPTSRFVYEDAEELFQSLQANVSGDPVATEASLDPETEPVVPRPLVRPTYSMGLPCQVPPPSHHGPQPIIGSGANSSFGVFQRRGGPLSAAGKSTAIVSPATRPYLEMQYATLHK